jgi:hypothetical protein
MRNRISEISHRLEETTARIARGQELGNEEASLFMLHRTILVCIEDGAFTADHEKRAMHLLVKIEEALSGFASKKGGE